jgi:hypothetical protein
MLFGVCVLGVAAVVSTHSVAGKDARLANDGQRKRAVGIRRRREHDEHTNHHHHYYYYYYHYYYHCYYRHTFIRHA